MNINTFIVVILIIVFIILIVLSTGALRIRAGGRLKERRFIYDYKDGEYKTYNEFKSLQRQGKIRPVAKWENYVEQREVFLNDRIQWKSYAELRDIGRTDLWYDTRHRKKFTTMRGPIDKFKYYYDEDRDRKVVLDKKQYYALFPPGEDPKKLVKGWNSLEVVHFREFQSRGLEATPSPISMSVRRAKQRKSRLLESELYHPEHPGHPSVEALKRGEIQLPDAELRWKDWRQQLRVDGITTDELADLMKVDFKKEDFVILTDLSGPWKQCCHHIEGIRRQAMILNISRFFLPGIYFYPFSTHDNFVVDWGGFIKGHGSDYPHMFESVIKFYDSESFRSCVGSFVSQTIMLDTFDKEGMDELYRLSLEIRPKRFGASVYTLHTDNTYPVVTTEGNRPTVQIDAPQTIGAESLLFILVDGVLPPAVLTGYPNYGGPFDQLPRELRIKLLDDYKRMIDQLHQTPGECAILFLNNKTVQHETPEPLFKNILYKNRDYNIKFPDAKGITRWMFRKIEKGENTQPHSETVIDIKLDDNALEKVAAFKRDKPEKIRRFPPRRKPFNKTTTIPPIFSIGENVVYMGSLWEVLRTVIIPDGSGILYLIADDNENKWVNEDILVNLYGDEEPESVAFPEGFSIGMMVHRRGTNFTGYIEDFDGREFRVRAWNRPVLAKINKRDLAPGKPDGLESFDDTLVVHLRKPNVIRFHPSLGNRFPIGETRRIELLENGMYGISSLEGRKLTVISNDDMRKIRDRIEVRRIGEDFLTIKDG